MLDLISRLWLTPKTVEPVKALKSFLKLYGRLWPGSKSCKAATKAARKRVKRRKRQQPAQPDKRKPNEPEEPPNKPVKEPESEATQGRNGWNLIREVPVCEVPVSELRYSQRTCGAFFRCGRKCLDLVQDLHAGKVDPRKADFLILDVFRKKDSRGRPVLWSADNRRLYALKLFQQYTKGQVKVRVRWQGDFSALKRFERNLDTDSDGVKIRFRPDSHRFFRDSARQARPARRRRTRY